jgi:NADH-quinone oxidoreductase subunit E
MVILNEIQNHIGFISEPMQVYVAEKLRIPASTVHGVVSFYSFFTTTARGRTQSNFAWALPAMSVVCPS